MFAIKYINNEIIEEQFFKIGKRLKNNNIVKNPFNSFIKTKIKSDGIYITVIELKPLYPNPFWLAVLFTAGISISTNLTLTYWYIIPAVLFFCSIPHTNTFQYYVFKFAMRKKGYKLPIEKVSLSEYIKV